MANKLFELTINQAHQLLKNKKISSLELTKSVLSRINHVEKKIRAFITLTPDLALGQARKVDQKIAKGKKLSRLAGIPVSIKDVFATKGIKTTTGSKILEGFISPYDASAVRRLKDADAVIVGKANQDEFSLGFTTETSAFQTTANPWDLTRTPGGSSGGSAAAVASGESIYSLCSEHYDSIRQPAAWTGLVGFKPTYGRVSRYGIVAMASSLECPGPITKTVEDAALVMEIIAGGDDFDANTVKKPAPCYFDQISGGVKGLAVGFPDEYLGGGLERGVKKRVLAAVKVFEKLGAKIKKVKLLPAKYSSAVYEVLYASEVASNLARYDGIRYGYTYPKARNLKEQYLKARRVFGSLIKTQMLVDLRALAGGEFEKIYLEAMKVRRVVKQDFDRVFEKVDLIIGPMTPCVAFKKGFYRHGRYQATPKTDKFRPLVDMYAHPPTLVGLPGISVPCGLAGNLPVGLQIYGPQFSEGLILKAAYAFERKTEWYKIKPDLKDKAIKK